MAAEGEVSCAQLQMREGGAWCGKYQIHLDTEGRFCRRCVQEPEFRRFLLRQLQVRTGEVCDGAAGAYCELFGVPTTSTQCEQCRGDALFRAFLRGQGKMQRRTKAQWLACRWRGELLRTEEKTCCGGKHQEVEVCACSQRGEAYDARCVVCTSFQPAADVVADS